MLDCVMGTGRVGWADGSPSLNPSKVSRLKGMQMDGKLRAWFVIYGLGVAKRHQFSRSWDPVLSTTVAAAGSCLLLHCLTPSFLVLWGPTPAVGREQVTCALLSSAVLGWQQCLSTGGSDPLLIQTQEFGWESTWLLVPQKHDSQASV